MKIPDRDRVARWAAVIGAAAGVIGAAAGVIEVLQAL